MQTLFEAEQVCTELQHSVSGLDSRLAELLHWETDARELYQLLRATERQQRGQDPRARVRWSIDQEKGCSVVTVDLNFGYSETVKAPMASLLSFHIETLMCIWGNADSCSTSFIPPGSDFPWSTAGGSSGHRGAGPAGDGDNKSEELSHPVPPRHRHAGTSASRCCSVTGQLSSYNRLCQPLGFACNVL